MSNRPTLIQYEGEDIVLTPPAPVYTDNWGYYDPAQFSKNGVTKALTALSNAVSYAYVNYTPSEGFIDFIIPVINSSNFQIEAIAAGIVTVFKPDGRTLQGSTTVVHTPPIPYVTGDAVRILAIANVVNIYVNGEEAGGWFKTGVPSEGVSISVRVKFTSMSGVTIQAPVIG